MSTAVTLAELEILTEAELEAIIHKDPTSQLADDARYSLGKNQIEGVFPERIPRNEKKGLQWVKQAVEHNHLPALEYKTYYDIRFEKHPSIKKIVASLEKCVESAQSCRAACTLAEFCAAQPDVEGNKEKACKYYKIAAD